MEQAALLEARASGQSRVGISWTIARPKLGERATIRLRGNADGARTQEHDASRGGKLRGLRQDGAFPTSYERPMPAESSERELGARGSGKRFELGAKEMRSPEYLRINPNARVPTLDDGDVRITESGAIAQYLAAKYGNGRFVPDVSSPEFPVYLQWLHYGEGMIMGAMNNFVVETVFLPPEKSSQVHADRALSACT